MKLLWIVNNPTAEMCTMLGLKPSVYGGWVSSLLDLFKQKSEIELIIATEHQEAKGSFLEKKDGMVTHVIVPSTSSNSKKSQLAQRCWKDVAKKYKPDIIHVHGTENVFGLNYIIANGNTNVVASIQGLTSVITRYYTGGLPKGEFMKFCSVFEYLRGISFYQQSKIMHQRANNELEFIKGLRHIVGRTEWDKIHSKTINPSIQYHKCNEALRPAFYMNKWSKEKMEPKRIFVSNVRSTIKGGYWAIKIFKEVLKKEPNARLVIAAGSPIKAQESVPFFKSNSLYKLLLKELKSIPNYKEKVELLGGLSEQEMCDEFLKCNAYLLPSAIENSSNSLGEAQILGVPIVASYVGGNAEFLQNGNAGKLYRFEEYEMGANAILQCFKDSDNTARELSMQIAESRHNIEYIYQDLMDIYKLILEEN